MRRQTLLAVALAGLLALAGCTGSMTTAPESGSDSGSGGGSTADSAGTVQFYVSDQPTAISEFEHLNVTITRIGFERAGEGGEEDDATNATVTATTTPANATVTATPTEAEEDAEREEGPGDGDDARAGNGWVTVETNRTVDLTRLQGDNATLIGQPEIPAGNYTKVFVSVGEINATLTDGSSANMKLPSGRLQLTKGFALEPNGTVQFVYDISVVKAGQSGKYILKPVISESGADQPIREVDRDGEDSDGEDDGSADSEEGDGENNDGDDGENEPADNDRGQGNA